MPGLYLPWLLLSTMCPAPGHPGHLPGPACRARVCACQVSLRQTSRRYRHDGRRVRSICMPCSTLRMAPIKHVCQGHKQLQALHTAPQRPNGGTQKVSQTVNPHVNLLNDTRAVSGCAACYKAPLQQVGHKQYQKHAITQGRIWSKGLVISAERGLRTSLSRCLLWLSMHPGPSADCTRLPMLQAITCRQHHCTALYELLA